MRHAYLMCVTVLTSMQHMLHATGHLNIPPTSSKLDLPDVFLPDPGRPHHVTNSQQDEALGSDISSLPFLTESSGEKIDSMNRPLWFASRSVDSRCLLTTLYFNIYCLYSCTQGHQDHPLQDLLQDLLQDHPLQDSLLQHSQQDRKAKRFMMI